MGVGSLHARNGKVNDTGLPKQRGLTSYAQLLTPLKPPGASKGLDPNSAASLSTTGP